MQGSGQLPDGQGTFEERLLARTRQLKRQPKIAKALTSAPHLYRRTMILVLLLLAILGASAVSQALAQGGRTLNIFWILIVLLGFHTLSLLLWLLFTALLRTSNSGVIAPLFQRLLQWFMPHRNGSDPMLEAANRAWLETSFQSSFESWRLGRITHSGWLSYLAGGLVGMLILFATREFDFVWESTLLSGETFVQLTHMLAAPLELMNAPVPSDAQILAAGRQIVAENDASARRAWALLLLGCIMLYGVAPRTLAWLCCAAMEKHGHAQWQINTARPYYLKLHRQLWPQTSDTAILDADQHPTSAAITRAAERLAEVPADALWLGLELNQRIGWPAPVREQQIIGRVMDQASLQQAQEQLRRQPGPLAVLVDANRPADRGLIRSLTQLVTTADNSRCWLVLHSEQPIGANKLQTWIDAAVKSGLSPHHLIPMADLP